jgi:hypothetical protein
MVENVLSGFEIENDEAEVISSSVNCVCEEGPSDGGTDGPSKHMSKAQRTDNMLRFDALVLLTLIAFSLITGVTQTLTLRVHI